MDSALVSAEMLALLGVDHLVQAGSPGAVAAAAGEGEGAAGVGEARHRQDAAATSTAPPPSAPAPAHASLAYVSQSLAAQGFGALPSEAEFGERPAEAAARVANAVQSLLEELRAGAEARSAAGDARARLTSDRRLAEQRCARLEADVRAKDRLLAAAEAKARKAGSKSEAELRAAKGERDEARRALEGLQRRDAQHQNEVRRREREAERLRAKLAALLDDKGERAAEKVRRAQLSPAGQREIAEAAAAAAAADVAAEATVTSPHGVAVGGRGAWAGKAGARESASFYRMILNTYERKQEELLQENADLRAQVRGLQTELAECMKKYEAARGGARRAGSASAEASPAKQHAKALSRAAASSDADADESFEELAKFDELARACAGDSEVSEGAAAQ